MTTTKFNNMMNAIKTDCHETGMGHWLVPKIAQTIMQFIEVEEPIPTSCKCEGYYKPSNCPIHGSGGK